MKTVSVKSIDVTRKWYLIDAEGVALGRVAAKAAQLIQGKHKAAYVPHIDNGDFVVIINAEKFLLSGRKPLNKVYRRHSGYPGGMHITKFEDMLDKKPLFPMERAIKGMMPKNKLARKMMKKVYLFEGSEHNFSDKELIPVEVK